MLPLAHHRTNSVNFCILHMKSARDSQLMPASVEAKFSSNCPDEDATRVSIGASSEHCGVNAVNV